MPPVRSNKPVETDDELFVPGNPTLYREQGIKYARLRKCTAALQDFFRAAVEEDKDMRSILYRTRAKLKCYQLDDAQKDAELALSLDPLDINALYLKAVAHFQRGEYELGLVYFYRGLRRRKMPRCFHEGICVASEVIDDCVGSNVGAILSEGPRYIKKMEEGNKNMFQRDKPREPSVQENLRRVKHDLYIGNVYLGRMHLDKGHLKWMKAHPDIVSPNKEGSAKLDKLVDGALNLLKERQITLYKRSPMYLNRFREATYSEKLRLRKTVQFEVLKKDIRSTAWRLIERLRDTRAEKDMRKFEEGVDHIKTYLDSKPARCLPKKQQYLELVYNICALAYLDEKTITPDDNDHDVKKKILAYFDIPCRRTSSLGVLFQNTQGKFVQFKRRIITAEERLKIAETSSEKAWLCHELARGFSETGKVDSARLFAKRCLMEAKAMGNYAWCVNACVIFTKCEMLHHSKPDAKYAIQEAIDNCAKLKMHGVMQYLEMCSRVIDETNFDDLLTTGMEDREMAIVRLLSNNTMRGEAQTLFQRMGGLPAERRMSLVPGVKTVNIKPVKENTTYLSAVRSTSKNRRRSTASSVT